MLSDAKRLTLQRSYTGKFESTLQEPERSKILIVDAEHENLVALAAALECTDYRIVTASSGQEALRLVLEEDFAAILLAVQMPTPDGFETARLIKARHNTRHIPIIFITAASQASEHVQKGFEVGAFDYIFRPFSPDTVRYKVNALIKLSVSHKYVRRLVDARTAQLNEINKKLREEVAERKKMAESFKTLFDVSPCLMAIKSLEDGRYLEVNKSWLNYTGFEYQELVGKRNWALSIISNSDNTPVFGGLSDLSKIYNNIRVTYVTKAGEKRNGLLSTELVELNNKVCLLIVMIDISEQVRLERELARLDSFNLIGEMAAGLAHEIRNPMSTISGFLQLSKVKGKIAPGHIDIMIEEIKRANSIITEFLSLAKDKRSERKLTCLNSIINALEPLLKAEALLQGKEIKVTQRNCPHLYLDEKEIRQLILNLTMNGLEAMQKGGLLEIETATVGGNVLLTVKDNGHGINEEIIEKIAIPFFTTRENGTGLGLPICYSIAARHDAVIDFETGSDGTTFFVLFSTEQQAYTAQQ